MDDFRKTVSRLHEWEFREPTGGKAVMALYEASQELKDVGEKANQAVDRAIEHLRDIGHKSKAAGEEIDVWESITPLKTAKESFSKWDGIRSLVDNWCETKGRAILLREILENWDQVEEDRETKEVMMEYHGVSTKEDLNGNLSLEKLSNILSELT